MLHSSERTNNKKKSQNVLKSSTHSLVHLDENLSSLQSQHEISNFCSATASWLRRAFLTRLCCVAQVEIAFGFCFKLAFEGSFLAPRAPIEFDSLWARSCARFSSENPLWIFVISSSFSSTFIRLREKGIGKSGLGAKEKVFFSLSFPFPAISLNSLPEAMPGVLCFSCGVPPSPPPPRGPSAFSLPIIYNFAFTVPASSAIFLAVMLLCINMWVTRSYFLILTT